MPNMRVNHAGPNAGQWRVRECNQCEEEGAIVLAPACAQRAQDNSLPAHHADAVTSPRAGLLPVAHLT